MFDIFIRKINGESHNHRNVRNISITTGRILISFMDDTFIRYNPGEIEELKVLSNVRRCEEVLNGIFK